MKAEFTFQHSNAGSLPDTVSFASTGSGATTYTWRFGDGRTAGGATVSEIYTKPGTYNVTLTVTGDGGSDSVTHSVDITLNPPTPAFAYAILNVAHLPLNIATTNTTTNAVSYLWDFGDGTTSALANPNHTYTKGGVYTIKLTATNPAGSNTASQTVYVSPYRTSYKDFNGDSLSLFAWEGKKVAVLSKDSTLNPTTMFAWATTMDSVYNFYRRCTGRDPNIFYTVNNHTTVADVPSTCGAGCGELGYTGVELLSSFFDLMYNDINTSNQYDQAVFYEFGRNFWFYGGQLAYKTNDPVTTGYAVFMRFMAMEATGVQGGPFNGVTPFADFKASEEALVDQYLSNTALNWQNTLGANAGVPGGFGGATDLFASFCMRLRRDYGGDVFLNDLWQEADKQPPANSTQDAVDNFILAACAAAHKNLTNLFMVQWRWPMSAPAQKAASQYP